MHFYFIGVTTKQSAMVQILPLWSQALNIKLDLIGIDLSLDASPSQYREAVARIKNDPDAIGSVVTTHKTKLFEHAFSLFDKFDTLAEVTKEVCSITRRAGVLEGLAGTDCLSTTHGLNDILGSDYWKSYASDVVCFGAGGVARSIALSLLCDFQTLSPFSNPRKYLPKRLVFVDINPSQIQSIKDLLAPFSERMQIEFLHQNEVAANDRLVASSSEHSLIINATGMGKDRPGSPLSNAVIFPEQSIAWDLNYRGERLFLQQAQVQKESRRLTIHDGWLCFMHGWTQSLQASLQHNFSKEQFDHLVDVAKTFRSK
jgi:shikimate dehydrogenase